MEDVSDEEVKDERREKEVDNKEEELRDEKNEKNEKEKKIGLRRVVVRS